MPEPKQIVERPRQRGGPERIQERDRDRRGQNEKQRNPPRGSPRGLGGRGAVAPLPRPSPTTPPLVHRERRDREPAQVKRGVHRGPQPGDRDQPQGMVPSPPAPRLEDPDREREQARREGFRAHLGALPVDHRTGHHDDQGRDSGRPESPRGRPGDSKRQQGRQPAPHEQAQHAAQRPERPHQEREGPCGILLRRSEHRPGPHLPHRDRLEGEDGLGPNQVLPHIGVEQLKRRGDDQARRGNADRQQVEPGRDRLCGDGARPLGWPRGTHGRPG